MKESWLEKLIELLNEYEKLNMCRTFIGYYKEEEEITWDIFSIKACELISKKFWFIKWLVENDKIDIDKLEKKVLKENLIRKFDEWLLMLLAIQDEPIRFLCEIIK